MNTIHSMPKKRNFIDPVFYIAQDGVKNSAKSMQVHILLLHDVKNVDLNISASIQTYMSFGTKNIVVANSDGTQFDKNLVDQFPTIQFLHLVQDEYAEDTSPIANVINKTFTSCVSDKIFISWTDIDPYGMSVRALERDIFNYSLCTVPALEDETAHRIFSVYTPQLTFGGIKIAKNNTNPHFPYTLFPHDFIGIYNREYFLSIGGIDSTILDPWVQLFDFGLRGYKNNYKIELSAYYRVRKIHSKRVSFSQKNKLEMYGICMRESIGNKLINFLKCICIDIRYFLSAVKLLFKKPSKQHLKFRNIVKEFWY